MYIARTVVKFHCHTNHAIILSSGPGESWLPSWLRSHFLNCTLLCVTNSLLCPSRWCRSRKAITSAKEQMDCDSSVSNNRTTQKSRFAVGEACKACSPGTRVHSTSVIAKNRVNAEGLSLGLTVPATASKVGLALGPL